jgi:glutathione S-transferase
MKLYYSPGACSMACQITLQELGFQYESIKLDTKNKPADFLQKNPKGYIPALLLDNGEMLTEGVAIMQYLADQKPEKNLIPKFGTWERYRAIEMLNFISTEIHKGFSPMWGAERIFPENKASSEQLKSYAFAALGKKFDIFNTALINNKFLLGDQFSVCDAYLFTVVGWTKILKADMSKWPTLLGYCERIQTRPAVQAAMKIEGLT